MAFELAKSFDEYEIKARYIPALIASIPIIVLVSSYERDAFFSLFSASNSFLVVENITLSAVYIAFLINFQRFVGKYIIENLVFKNGSEFPTTTMILWNDTSLSKDFKRKLYEKINRDFELNLMHWIKTEDNNYEAKTLARETIALIRNKVKKGHLTHSHNIQYGFMRNMIAGFVLSLPFSIVNIYLFIKVIVFNTGLIFSLFLTFLSAVFIIFLKPILKKLAESYARVLLTEYAEM